VLRCVAYIFRALGSLQVPASAKKDTTALRDRRRPRSSLAEAPTGSAPPGAPLRFWSGWAGTLTRTGTRTSARPRRFAPSATGAPGASATPAPRGCGAARRACRRDSAPGSAAPGTTAPRPLRARSKFRAVARAFSGAFSRPRSHNSLPFVDTLRCCNPLLTVLPPFCIFSCW
jgi:hypothetical protein